MRFMEATCLSSVSDADVKPVYSDISEVEEITEIYSNVTPKPVGSDDTPVRESPVKRKRHQDFYEASQSGQVVSQPHTPQRSSVIYGPVVSQGIVVSPSKSKSRDSSKPSSKHSSVHSSRQATPSRTGEIKSEPPAAQNVSPLRDASQDLDRSFRSADQSFDASTEDVVHSNHQSPRQSGASAVRHMCVKCGSPGPSMCDADTQYEANLCDAETQLSLDDQSRLRVVDINDDVTSPIHDETSPDHRNFDVPSAESLGCTELQRQCLMALFGGQPVSAMPNVRNLVCLHSLPDTTTLHPVVFQETAFVRFTARIRDSDCLVFVDVPNRITNPLAVFRDLPFLQPYFGNTDFRNFREQRIGQCISTPVRSMCLPAVCPADSAPQESENPVLPEEQQSDDNDSSHDSDNQEPPTK